MEKNQEKKINKINKINKKELKRIEEKFQRKADNVFSKYIRIKYSDDNGICKCVTCGRSYHYKEINCGHYIKRDITYLRYDERNCHPQCVRCNHHLSGNLDEYAFFITNTYGLDVFNELHFIKNKIFTESKSLFCQEKFIEYKEKLKNLLKERNLYIMKG